MSRRVVVRPRARTDIETASFWYETRQPGLGIRFVNELDRLFERVEESPFQFPEIEGGVRRGLLRRFPYGVYFAPEPERIVIIAVLHLHRHPETWKQRK